MTPSISNNFKIESGTNVVSSQIRWAEEKRLKMRGIESTHHFYIREPPSLKQKLISAQAREERMKNLYLSFLANKGNGKADDHMLFLYVNVKSLLKST